MKNIIDLIKSDDWPQAVDINLVCDESNEKDKTERAESIVTLVINNAHYGKRVLDFGCGEGHVADFMLKYGASNVVGYDIQNKFSNFEKVLLTTNWDIVEKNGPYDFINVYDVMDHLENINQIEAFILLKSVLAEGGKIYVRYHPYMSRHGAHIYKHLNKAFAHIFLEEDEIKELVPVESMIFTHAITFPQTSYSHFSKLAGLKTEASYNTTKKVEDFFNNLSIQNYLKNKLKISKFPIHAMTIEFIDKVYTI